MNIKNTYILYHDMFDKHFWSVYTKAYERRRGIWKFEFCAIFLRLQEKETSRELLMFCM
ncbi:hypothetical protein EMIT0210MI2_13350 [Priestia megaterium]